MPSTVHIGAAREAHAGLLAIGYQPGTPERIGRTALAIDRQVAAEAECEACGRQGLELSTYCRGRSYVALATCPACGWAVEM